MKHLVFAVTDKTAVTEKVLSSLIEAGYNGTVIPSNSLKHTLLHDEEDVPNFISLATMPSNNLENNTTFFIVVEEDEVEDVKNIIRKETGEFSLCHGGMFTLPLASFEGSF